MRSLALLAAAGLAAAQPAAPTVSPNQVTCPVQLAASKPIQCNCDTFGSDTLPWNNRPHKYCGHEPEEFAGAVHFTCPHCFEQGMQFNVTCPNGWATCELFVLTYHCPGCSGPTNGGWVANLPGEGWRPASCAPNFCIDGKAHPMVSLYSRILGGVTAELPASTTDPTMYFSLVVKEGKVCEDIADQGECTGGLCAWEDGACVTSWCPPKGPDAPGISCTPCAPRDCDATSTPTRATAAPTGATPAPSEATGAPVPFTVPPQPAQTATPTKRVVSALDTDPPLQELSKPLGQ